MKRLLTTLFLAGVIVAAVASGVGTGRTSKIATAASSESQCTGETSVPTSGTLTLAYVQASTKNADRNDYRLSGTLRWDSEAALQCFAAGRVDWAYEHEIRYGKHFDRKIWNEDVSGFPPDSGPYI